MEYELIAALLRVFAALVNFASALINAKAKRDQSENQSR